MEEPVNKYCWYSFLLVEEKKHLTFCIIAENFT